MCDEDADALDEPNWDEYESGPFCEHWSDPCDCDELCKCGHECYRHNFGGCKVAGCECQEFEDPE